MSVAIIDYGMGNLASVNRVLEELGETGIAAATPEDMDRADRIIIPGVGNFTAAMENLRAGGWVEPIRAQVRSGKPLLGICLGMQLLATMGTESGDCEGLDLIPGEVVFLEKLGCNLRVPHVGWNEATPTEYASTLFAGIPPGTDFYFVHSYAFRPTHAEHVQADTPYGIRFASAVAKDNVFGAQFHPEKSSKAGQRILKNFLAA